MMTVALASDFGAVPARWLLEVIFTLKIVSLSVL